MYDLTPFLTTVASCSATIIAIIGGFMVRKLIAISTERHEMVYQLDEMAEDIKLKESQLGRLTARHRLNDAAIVGMAVDDPALAAAIDERESLSAEMEQIRTKTAIATARLDALKNPHGMKTGLMIFAIFTLFGVFFPMALIPFQTEHYSRFLTVKILLLATWGTCMAGVYRYLLAMLGWRTRDVTKGLSFESGKKPR